ncbi:MAG: hypothetical protein H6713_34465 [Myxococcales bacterium]|nr:hypothetical protein [Myxococcales bacterium]MCB9755069.1 hypothetical protein [Myxococcales bacterium]
MGLLSSLLDRLLPSYPRADSIAAAQDGRVELAGTVELLEDDEPLQCPLTGAPAVAIFYRGRAPGLAAHAYGGQGDALDLSISGRESRDFILRDATGSAIVRVRARGGDVARLHERLVEQHGLSLRSESELLGPGERVTVRGEVVERDGVGGPHRRGPHLLTIAADAVTRASD